MSAARVGQGSIKALRPLSMPISPPRVKIGPPRRASSKRAQPNRGGALLSSARTASPASHPCILTDTTLALLLPMSLIELAAIFSQFAVKSDVRIVRDTSKPTAAPALVL